MKLTVEQFEERTTPSVIAFASLCPFVSADAATVGVTANQIQKIVSDKPETFTVTGYTFVADAANDSHMLTELFAQLDYHVTNGITIGQALGQDLIVSADVVQAILAGEHK